MSRPPIAIPIFVLAVALLALAACEPLVPAASVPMVAPAGLAPTPCESCNQATAFAVLTQEGINASARQAQARATAEILGAQALATSNAGTSTQGAAVAQEAISASARQAQAAATADILRADALATANAASSTQGSALTQVAVQQTQVQLRAQMTVEAATQSAMATGTQQRIGNILAGTGTALARAMSSETQSALALAQRTAAQRQAQQQGPSVFLWTWGLPVFVVVAAVLGLWGFWRWLKMHTTQPPVIEQLGGPLILQERRSGLAERRVHPVALLPPTFEQGAPRDDPPAAEAPPLLPDEGGDEMTAPPRFNVRRD